jgi:hypothetical protein
MPPFVRRVLPWARRHVAAVARRYGLGQHDLWDETLTALLRAAIYYTPEIGAFAPYAHTPPFIGPAGATWSGRLPAGHP